MNWAKNEQRIAQFVKWARAEVSNLVSSKNGQFHGLGVTNTSNTIMSTSKPVDWQNNKLTKKCRVLIDKLTVAQLVKNTRHFLESIREHCTGMYPETLFL
jgi:hypothetical protein